MERTMNKTPEILEWMKNHWIETGTLSPMPGFIDDGQWYAKATTGAIAESEEAAMRKLAERMGIEPWDAIVLAQPGEDSTNTKTP